jgi:hypothetical protein
MTKSGDDTMNKEMKSERITLRVSPKEKKEIEKKAAQAHLSVSKYLLRVSEFDDPQKFKENVLINICASVFYPAQDLQKIIDGINTDNYTIQRKIYEIDDLLMRLLENTARLAEFLDKQEKSEPESDQYKRINKQLGKLINLINLMSENE